MGLVQGTRPAPRCAADAPVRLAWNRADDGARTRDPQLGKLTLYQLSYVRVTPG